MERIPTLTKLDLSSCANITSVSCLASSTSVVELDLSNSAVTSEGLVGLERIPTLTRVELRGCQASHPPLASKIVPR